MPIPESQYMPALGERHGKCPGYIIDHVIPLCAGDADTPASMQLRSRAAAKRKDVDEAQQCRAMP